MTVALALWLAAAGTADPAQARRVEAYLGSADTPVPAARWRALGRGALGPLVDVARDPERLPSQRARALGALGVLGGARARAVVLAVARDAREPFAVRASALHAVPGVVSGRNLLRELRAILERDGTPAVRGAAAEVLARSGGSRGCAAVRARFGLEPAATQVHFRAALERCGPDP